MKKSFKEPKIAYVIPGPTEHLTLEVKHSANAWWMEAPKLHRLLRAFEAMSPIEEACNYAGITVKQYKYFAQEHPIVKELRTFPHVELSLIARMRLAKALSEDPKLAYRFLAQKDRVREGKIVKKDKRNEMRPNPAKFYELVDGELKEI